MNLSCSNQDACPVILDSKCVIYEGENLLYIGVNTNDNFRTALQNINTAIGNLVLSGGITELTGDVIAIGPGVTPATLATVNSTPGQFGSSTAIPKLTVDGKGRVTAITTEAVFIPSGALDFFGDVSGSGNTGTPVELTLDTVNVNTYLSNTFLKFAVNGKGLVTSATPVVSSDITSALGYIPYNSTNPNNYISRAGLSAVTPLIYDSNTGQFTIQQANSVQNGYLSATDWNTFNSKQGFIAAGTTAQYWRGDKTWQTLDTSVVPENTNLYWTQTRFNSAFLGKSTSDLAEGTNLYYTQARFDTAFGAKSTTDLVEGTNLYFTAQRAKDAITGTAPISVVNGVVSISQAGASSDGYLSSSDWNTFNNKQVAGNYITQLTGEASASGPGVASVTLSDAAVVAKVLTGLNITGGTVLDTDSLLIAIGKIQNQLNALYGGSQYQGVWNAATNTPTLTSGVGTKGHYYIVNVPGTTNLDGITDWNLGDWAIFDGTAWQQVDNTDAVVSVNGFTGAVSLTTDNIPEGALNQYYTAARARLALSAGTGISYDNITGVISSTITQYTDALARQAISLTTTGSSGAATYDNVTGVFNIPNYTAALTGYVPYTGATTNVDLGTYGLISDYLQLNNLPTSIPTTAGTMAWNDNAGTVDIKLKRGAVTLQVGQENVIPVINKTGINLLESNYQAVRVRTAAEGGAQGQRLAVLLAQGNNDPDSATTIGIVTETINDNQEGFITVFGNVSEINTTGSLQGETWVDGDILYLSPTTPGAITNIKPVAPQHLITLGYVVYAHSQHGIIFVKVDNGYELGELHDVYAPSPVNTASIYWNSTTNRYENNTIAGILGYTPANAAALGNYVTLSGAQTITGIKTFTNEQLFGNGITLTGGYITYEDSGFNLTLNTNILTANRNIFLQDGSGTLAFTSDIPSLAGYVPTSRTLTINGVSYDLSADRSWTIAAGVSGSGTTNYIARWNSSSSLTTGSIYDTGTAVTIGATNGVRALTVYSGTADNHVAVVGVAPSVSMSDLVSGASYQAKFGLATSNGQFAPGAIAGDFVIISQTAGIIFNTNSNTVALKLAGSGAATFANSVTAGSFVKSGGTASQILAADGSVITAGIGITISGGTISSTASGGVTSFNTRTGAVTLSSADVTGALGYTPYNSTNPSGYITSSASITGTSSGVTQSLSGGNDANLVYAAMADNDFFRIRVGGTSNAGWVEIATADDGTEPIYVRQYTGVFSSLTRTATLLDGSGNTSFPGTVTAPTFSGSLSGNASSATTASSVAWGNVSGKPSLIMYYQGFTLNADTMDGNSTGFTYSNNAPYTGPVTRFSETGYSLQLNAAYGGGGTQFAFRTRNGDAGSFNAWRRILNDGADPYAANMNQYVRTSDSPSFLAVSGNDVYTTGGWFRNHTNNNGIYWSNTGWHLYPKNANDFYLRSGGNGESSIQFMDSAGNAKNYIHNASDNAIGFLSTSRSWILRVDNSGNTTASGDVTAYSDRRIKKDIAPIQNALSKVLLLNGVTYKRTDNEDDSTKLGFIAQDVEKVVSEVVNYDAKNDRYSVSYGNISALIVEAMKEQQVKIDKQDKVIEELKSIINDLTK